MLDTDGIEGQFSSTVISLKPSEVGKINWQTGLTTRGGGNTHLDLVSSA